MFVFLSCPLLFKGSNEAFLTCGCACLLSFSLTVPAAETMLPGLVFPGVSVSTGFQGEVSLLGEDENTPDTYNKQAGIQIFASCFRRCTIPSSQNT